MNFKFSRYFQINICICSVKGNKNLIGEVIRIPVGKKQNSNKKVNDFAQLLNVYCNFFAELYIGIHSITTHASLINGKDRKSPPNCQ